MRENWDAHSWLAPVRSVPAGLAGKAVPFQAALAHSRDKLTPAPALASPNAAHGFTMRCTSLTNIQMKILRIGRFCPTIKP